jgi:hypothetical protein
MIPFSDDDFVGPEDRPQPEDRWELTMVEWRVQSTVAIKEFLDDSAPGGVATAIRCAPMPTFGAIVAQSCAPDTPKAQALRLSGDHRTVTFSLYVPLLKFHFPKVKAGYKAVFPCRVQHEGDKKVLVIDVANYRVERVKKDEAEAESQPGTGGSK